MNEYYEDGKKKKSFFILFFCNHYSFNLKLSFFLFKRIMRKGKKKAWSFKKEYVLGMMSRL